MEPTNTPDYSGQSEVKPVAPKSNLLVVCDPLCRVTSLSKILAAVLFILMPFIGAWIGYEIGGEKIVQVSHVVQNVTPTQTQSDEVLNVTELQKMEGQSPSLEVIEVEMPVTDSMKPTSGKSEIFVNYGTSSKESLGEFEGVCSISQVDENFLSNRSILSTYITDPANILSRVYCGWSDDGSETVLYNKLVSATSTPFEVLHVELASCEGMLECTATDTVSVLKTFNP